MTGYREVMRDFAGRDLLVVGTGTDARTAAALAADRGAHVRTVPDAEAALAGPPADLVMVDEWTAETAPHVARIRRAGGDAVVPAEVILDAIDRPVIAVTGSAGKTGTCRLVADLLRASGVRVAVADARLGNAWPNATLCDGRAEGVDVVVAELTSTHLCYMRGWSGAAVGALTVLWPDHIELHGSLVAYEAAKLRVLDTAERVVVGADETLAPPSRWGQRLAGTFSLTGPVARGAGIVDGWLWGSWADGSSGPLMEMDAVPRAIHPRTLVVAVSIAGAWGVDPSTIAGAVMAHRGARHRMTEIANTEDRVLIDDSVCATPRKLMAALDRCPPGRTVLVAGGARAVDGHPVHEAPEEREALRQALARMTEVARVVVPFGGAADLLTGLPAAVSPLPDLESAIRQATAVSRPGETVLVSPMFPVSREERERVPEFLRTGMSA